jgi:hypothetical protein
VEIENVSSRAQRDFQLDAVILHGHNFENCKSLSLLKTKHCCPWFGEAVAYSEIKFEYKINYSDCLTLIRFYRKCNKEKKTVCIKIKW